MDLATILGFLLGSSLLWIAIILGKTVELFIDIDALLFVIGGTVSLMFIRHKITEVYSSVGIFMKTLFVHQKKPEVTVDTLYEMADRVRGHGILSLELVKVNDPFLQNAINLCTKGADPAYIEEILTDELDARSKRHARGIDLCRGVGNYAFLVGLLGAFIEGVKLLAGAKALTWLTLGAKLIPVVMPVFYGLVIYTFTRALAGKLQDYSDEERCIDELSVKGINGIQKGINPRMLKESLSIHLPPKWRR